MALPIELQGLPIPEMIFLPDCKIRTSYSLCWLLSSIKVVDSPLSHIA